jgi:hypothetical protein|tara:strand:- start:3345 stop:3971 length:627 start_codon:yes stop_codon:yes gene_type:complete
MANTTFAGPIRSEGGFTTISKNGTTGAISTLSSINSSGFASLDANTMAVEAGTGITTGSGTLYRSSVQRVGGIITTRILIDLTGLRSTGSGDIIGVNGTALVCHIGQITAATNGTILTGSMECFEAPAGGDPDINIHSATEGTGVEDGAISGLAETLLVDAGDATLGSKVYFTAVPAADEFLYLTTGAATDADYTAGKLFIQLMGYEA